MKKILKSLLTLSVVAAIMVGVTSAVWTDNTKVTNSASFSTVGADLQIWDANYLGQSWQETIEGPGFDDICPNWTQDYSLKVKNSDSTNLMLSLGGQWESGALDACNLDNQIAVHVWKFNDSNTNYHWDSGEDTADLGQYTLQQWHTNSLSAGQLDAGDQQWFLLRFSVGELGEEFQNCTMSGYSFMFDGTTDGATQPASSPKP